MTAQPPKIITDIEALALELNTRLKTLHSRKRAGYMSQQSLDDGIKRAQKAFRAKLQQLLPEAK